jgi:DNA-binding NarL/FixJ family response regulator
LETLTDRCREVAKLRAEGLLTGQIAKELRLPVKEVKECLDALWGWGGDAGAPVG